MHYSGILAKYFTLRSKPKIFMKFLMRTTILSLVNRRPPSTYEVHYECKKETVQGEARPKSRLGLSAKKFIRTRQT